MCPVCGNKTRLKIREDTELKKFPLYCPKCRQENLIEIKQFKVTVITEPDAKTQSPEGSPHNFPKAQPCLNRF
ncbi:cysteine-rich KTR domain-containing protein [Vibrio parahaemolyticus]|uniref:Conjugal transfer protein n=6 Tax=cellular organisms TaxID=131567 RepID=A0A1P8DQM7_VIBPH|nr:conjugal transfer protein [Vibrio parahaemolyticus]AWK84571.1 conjugal transfer protein [Photobacterium damselae]MBO0139327.1 cysteine-rich KTR domain-containing protein [Vibrio sp. Vb2736]MBO0165565.1 cysteine-rich KTR domain-containing protein [Vibrio alginolyticus]MBO0210656.1 cysteine-rich KTR domain-containing protein [Vibrio sp. Vb0877]MBO0246481.1 cysteine-rich KTR domain-containing protein [Vibrio sp. Vb0592]